MPFDGYKIQIVDFSNDYFRQSRDGMPEEREGKFVLMRDNGRKMEYLVLSLSEQCTYHAEIVERFCRRFRIRVSKTVRPRRFVIEDPNWEVAGGGRWNWHGGEKRLLLHGESLQYGPCDLDVIWERLSKVPEIADWQILIDQ